MPYEQLTKHKENIVHEAWRPGVPRNLDRYILKDQVNRSAYHPGVSRYFYDSLPKTLGRILYEKLGADELSGESWQLITAAHDEGAGLTHCE